MLAILIVVIDMTAIGLIGSKFFSGKKRPDQASIEQFLSQHHLTVDELGWAMLEWWVFIFAVIWIGMIICSMWVWLYFVGLHAMRGFVWLFDVEKQPIKSVGILVSCALGTAQLTPLIASAIFRP